MPALFLGSLLAATSAQLPAGVFFNLGDGYPIPGRGPHQAIDVVHPGEPQSLRAQVPDRAPGYSFVTSSPGSVGLTVSPRDRLPRTRRGSRQSP